MKGIRIHEGRGNGVGRDEYTLVDLVLPIKEDISNLFWIFANTGFKTKNQEEAEELDLLYRKSVYDETSDAPHFFCLSNGSLPLMSKFIIPGWSLIYGIREKIRLMSLLAEEQTGLDESAMFEKTEVLFACINGKRWEVYARNPEIIEKLHDAFPDSEIHNFGK